MNLLLMIIDLNNHVDHGGGYILLNAQLSSQISLGENQKMLISICFKFNFVPEQNFNPPKIEIMGGNPNL